MTKKTSPQQFEEQWIEVLQGMSVMDFPKKDIITFQEDASVGHVLERLSKANVTSAPVVTREGWFVGMADMVDIACHVATFVNERTAPGTKPAATVMDWADGLFINHTITSILKTDAKRNATVIMKPTATAADLINKMERTHAHRALVINDEKKIERVITQTDVLRMIGRHEKLIRQATHAALGDLLLITRDVHTLRESTSCVELVLAMRELDISVIGIVNEDGKLVDSFSVSDLRGVTPQLLSSLVLPPASFKSFVSKRILEPPVHVKEKSRFGNLITKMINSHLHVVYIVEEEKPTGIITLTDVIRTATYALPMSS